ncbi:MAG: zf-HC2 domain-containing protein [Candidatus Saccharicenans sp.]|nr:zf-HC2 domain-containing protein [Candidatus Saccharicenans sp.]
MSCPGIYEIYAYLEEEMSAGERAALEEHLARCPRCQRLLADRRQLLAAISELSGPELPPEFTARIMTALPRFDTPSRLWFFLAGGIYAFFALTMTVLLLGSGGVLFRFCFELFRGTFNLASDLSSLIFRIIHSIYGLLKTFIIFLKLASEILSQIAPPPGLLVIAFVLVSVPVLALIRVLLRGSNYYRGEKA